MQRDISLVSNESNESVGILSSSCEDVSRVSRFFKDFRRICERVDRVRKYSVTYGREFETALVQCLSFRSKEDMCKGFEKFISVLIDSNSRLRGRGAS